MDSALRTKKPDASGNLTRTDWSRNPGFIIHDVQRVMVQVVDEAMAKVGLTNAQLRVILHLSQSEGVTQVHLSDEIGIKKASVGVLLERLEEKDLVQRRPDPADRRANLIYLSDKARALLGPIYESGNAVLDGLLDGIDRAEQTQLVDLLLRVKANADQMWQKVEAGKNGQ